MVAIVRCAQFDAYFRFSIGDEVLKKEEIDALIEQASDRRSSKEG